MNKICNKCKCEKSQTEFSKDKHKKDGLSTQCKACKAEYSRVWTANNKKLKAELDKDYRSRNLDKLTARKREYYLANKDQILDKNKSNYEINKDSYIATQSRWVKANKEKVNLIKKAYKLRRRDAMRSGHVTSQELSRFIDNELHVCTYCQKPLSSSYHIDHIEPLAKGGKHILSNLALACPSCNLSKQTRSAILFMAIKAIR